MLVCCDGVAPESLLCSVERERRSRSRVLLHQNLSVSFFPFGKITPPASPPARTASIPTFVHISHLDLSVFSLPLPFYDFLYSTLFIYCLDTKQKKSPISQLS